MATKEEWSSAYASQSKADFDTFQLLQTKPVPNCHRLMFLQMACEKLVKAHLCLTTEDVSNLQSSHAYIAKNLPTVLRQEIACLNYSLRQTNLLLRQAKQIAQEIEVLAPAVDRAGKRQDNCEYPWEDSSHVLHTPLDWSFAPLQLLMLPAGRTMLKLIATAIDHSASG